MDGLTGHGWPIYMQDQIASIHRLYCDLLGMVLPLQAAYERMWYDAIGQGLTEDSLRVVLLNRKADVKNGKRFRNCLLLRNLIGDSEIVADVINEFALLMAQKRAFTPNPTRDSVLRATGRVSEKPKTEAKSVGQLIKELKNSTH
jgi:hypothetical protein